MHQFEAPSQAVKRIIASKEQCTPSQLGRLEAAVDVEQLDALREPPIEFRYSGYHVRIEADGAIHTDP